MCFQWKSSLNCETGNYFLSQLLSSVALSFVLSALLFLPAWLFRPRASPSPQPDAAAVTEMLSACGFEILCRVAFLGKRQEKEGYWAQRFITIAALCVSVLRVLSHGRCRPPVSCRQEPPPQRSTSNIASRLRAIVCSSRRDFLMSQHFMPCPGFSQRFSEAGCEEVRISQIICYGGKAFWQEKLPKPNVYH